jgi:hypothetical protein
MGSKSDFWLISAHYLGCIKEMKAWLAKKLQFDNAELLAHIGRVGKSIFCICRKVARGIAMSCRPQGFKMNWLAAR